MGIAAYNRGSRVIREQIDREAEARRIAQSRPKVILLVDHPCNRDPTAQLTESTARLDKLSIFRMRGGYLASLGWPYCLDGLFATEEAARKAQEEFAQEEARALAQRRDRDRAQERCDMLNKLVGDDIFSPRD